MSKANIHFVNYSNEACMYSAKIYRAPPRFPGLSSPGGHASRRGPENLAETVAEEDLDSGSFESKQSTRRRKP